MFALLSACAGEGDPAGQRVGDGPVTVGSLSIEAGSSGAVLRIADEDATAPIAVQVASPARCGAAAGEFSVALSVVRRGRRVEAERPGLVEW